MRELIELCRKQDRIAQKALYDRYASQMFLLCRRYLRTDEIAEETLMNGFFKFFRQLPGFRYVNEAATTGWLKRIMVNECLMQLRQQHSFLRVSTDDLPDMETADEVLSKLNSEEIYRLILKLPLGYRTAFNMYALENYSHGEIAVILGITEGTSKSQVHKARKLLQQMLRQQNEYYALRQTR